MKSYVIELTEKELYYAAASVDRFIHLELDAGVRPHGAVISYLGKLTNALPIDLEEIKNDIITPDVMSAMKEMVEQNE